MLQVKYRKPPLTIRAVWFAEQKDKAFERNCDLVYYHHLLNKPSSPCWPVTTLWTKLDRETDDIIALIDKSVRYEIRRAQKDGVETKFINSQQLLTDPGILSAFSSAYNHFLKTKNLAGSFNSNVVKAYIKANAFYVSLARYQEQDYVFHGYVCDGSIGRLLYSVSLFRDENHTGTRALIGRANRLLHMNDILSFKELGYSIYDWGGCSDENEDLRKITNFKKGFGGDPVLVFDALVPCSLPGKLVLKVKNQLSS